MLGFFRRRKKSPDEDPRLTTKAVRAYDLADLIKSMDGDKVREYIAWAERMTNEYGRTLESHPGDIEDAAVLPCSKDELKTAIKVMMVFRLHPEHSDSLDVLRQAYMALARFQTPDEGDKQPLDSARYIPRAQAESSSLKADIVRFLR